MRVCVSRMLPKRTTALAGGAIAGGLLALTGPSVAMAQAPTATADVRPAINVVSCSDDNFLHIRYQGHHLLCFANAGAMTVSISDPYNMQPGNNSGAIECEDRPRNRWINFTAEHSQYLHGRCDRIITVRIN